MPAPGADFVRYGGHTACVALARDGEPPRIVLDAGTGLINLGNALGDQAFEGSILVGHLHWDHTQGMPFFRAGAIDGARADVYIPEQGESAEAVLAGSFSPPHFPIFPSELGPGWGFHNLPEGDHEIEGFTVRSREIPHKGGRTFGYRVGVDGVEVAYLSDHSPSSVGPGPDGLGARHQALLDLVEGVDLLIHDAQFLSAQSPGVDFLGHASVEYTVAVGRECGVGRVVLFHHAPTRTDDQLDVIARDARALDPAGPPVLAAYDGLSLDLAPRARV